MSGGALSIASSRTRHGMLLHVFTHVEAGEFVAQLQRELPGELGFSYTGRSGEEEAAGWPFRLTQPGARAFDRLRHQMHRFRLAEDHALQRFFERAQALAIRGGRLPRRNPGNAGDDALDVGGVDDQRLLDSRRQGR